LHFPFPGVILLTPSIKKLRFHRAFPTRFVVNIQEVDGMQNIWPPVSNLIGNRYRLHHSLGEGSFGEVFYAEDTKFDPPRPVALKLLHRAFLSDPAVREGLRHEAGVLARFSHPHILRVLDFEINPNQSYIITELAPNGSLSRLLRPDPTRPGKVLPLNQVAQILEQIATALDEAHGQGLIHRDIKPENILLDRYNQVLLADFGLALAITNPHTLNRLGSTGVWGTPEYAAPEVWDEKVSKHSDIYALGVLLYQMLSGQLPYQGSAAAVMRQHLDAPVPRLAEQAPDLNYPPALDAVLARAMAKEPGMRPSSAGELYQQFRQALDGAASPLPFQIKGETIREGFKLLKLAYNLINLLLTYRSRHDPSPELFTRRGLTFAKLELYGMARKSYDLALELDPEYAPAYRHRGLALLWQGDQENSRRDLERAAQLGDPRARQELSALRRQTN